MKKLLMYILFSFSTVLLFAQTDKDSIFSGSVNYQTSENIYVNFESTKGIQKGDTLFVKKRRKFIPGLIVNYISSKTIAGKSIGNIKLSVGDEVIALIKIKPVLRDVSPVSKVVEISLIGEEPESFNMTNNILIQPEPKLKGRVTVQSYSNFSNSGNRFGYQRWRYTFRLNAKNIGRSNLSYTQYINFAYRSDQWKDVNSNPGNAIRIYDLAFKYDFTQSTNLWLGRHINQKVSNLSSVDGLQFETIISSFSTGLIVGSRPNFSDMGFNTKLFEYGVYINRFDSLGQRGMENSLGYFEQTNNSKTDRRFFYFQHINSAIKNIRIFLSTEVDLYKNIPGKSKNDFSLTSLFISANIRPANFLTLYLSYDARKNVIYYETFKNFIDNVFENETRQGFNTHVTIKPVNNLFLGMNYGYRYRKGDPKPSNNYGGYITYSRIPVVETGTTISYNNLSSTYIKGTIVCARLYKDFGWGFGISADYSKTKYQFTQDIEDIIQQALSFSVNTTLLNPVYASIIYEGIFQGILTSGRVLFDLSYRF